MDKDQIRSKIEKEIESGNVELYISNLGTDYPAGYAVIKPIWQVSKESDGRLIAIRIDQKEGEEWTREKMMDNYIETIFKGIEKKKIESAPIWFRSLQEESNG